MFIRTERITPEAAQHYLDNQNEDNRPIGLKHVAFLAAQMQAGTWKNATGETIKFGKNGRLLDGQHRLMAVVKSGVSLEFQIADSCENDIFDVLDTGRNRSVGDAMSIGGVKYGSKIATPVRFLINYERGTLRRGEKLSNAQCLMFARENQRIGDSCRFADSLLKKMPLVAFSDLVIMHFLLSGADAEQGPAFLSKIITGAGLAEGTPGLLLRQKFERHKLGASNLSLGEKIALSIKAWNLTRQGKTVNLLVFRPDQEDFPKPI